MFAVGCLFPVVFAIGGVLLGGFIGGQPGSIWGGVIGLVTGFAVPAVMFYAFVKARRAR
ncbi:MAG: hypothetical protein ACTHMG_14295 [Sphingomonas sp.]